VGEHNEMKMFLCTMF